MPEEVILVDARNRALGSAEKQRAHEEGLLHRAFSIFLVDEEGRILLQQRDPRKYHSGGLWANTCCGHPRPGETTAMAARRRLREELGLRARLRFRFRTRYSAAFPNGLSENEVVHVFFGSAHESPILNTDEVAQVQWMSPEDARLDAQRRPERYAYWLRHYLTDHWAELKRYSKIAQWKEPPKASKSKIRRGLNPAPVQPSR